MGSKKPNPIDVHVGQRIRARRMQLGITQEKLADAIDLTFQQVQKYEKGTNRVGASRMAQIGAALKTPVSYFFEGAPGGSTPASTARDLGTELLAALGGVELARLYLDIPHGADRHALIAVAKALAGKSGTALRVAS